MRTKSVRIWAVVLIFSIVTALLPASTFAVTVEEFAENRPSTLVDFIAGAATVEDIYGTLDKSTVPEIIDYEEAVAKNHIARLYADEGTDLNKVIFLNIDGSKTMYTFDFPVKYVDDKGNIQDISLKIAADTENKGSFKTAANSAVTTFSAHFTDGISLTGNDAEICLIPILPSASSGTLTMSATANATAQRVDEKTVVYPYDTKTTVEYSLTYTGFKEDIVVSEYTGQTEYPFRLLTNGLSLEEIGDSFFLVDDKGNIKASIGDIIIFTADERNNTFGDIEAVTVRENQEYVLNIVVDAEYLADPATVYPIRIDPTVKINYNYGAGAVEDITISTNTNYSGTYDYLFVGRRQTEGIARILLRFPGLDVSELAGVTVTSAYVRIRDMMCEDDPLDVSCHIFTGSEWSESSATWANCSPNSYVTTPLSTNTLKWSIGDTFSNKHWYQFDVTAAVQGWIDGNYSQNKGLMFKVADSVENGDEILNRTFGSYNRTNYRPSLTVNYTEPGFQLLENDTYYLNNRGMGKYLQLNTDVTVKGISGGLTSLGNRVQWEIHKVSDGYVIRSATDSTQYLCCGASEQDNRVFTRTVIDSVIPESCMWIISIATNGGCLVKNMAQNKYLCANGTYIYTVSSTNTYGNPAYENCVWRIISTSYYGSSASHTYRELETGYIIHDIIVGVGEVEAPYVVKRPYNAIWADASDFVFTLNAGDSDCVSVMQFQNSFLGQKVGIVLYTATHKVTGQTTNFWVDTQTLLIFQTDETYRYDKNGNEVPGLQYGDMTLDELRDLQWVNWTDFLGQPPECYEYYWRSMVSDLFAAGLLDSVINDMIDHFMEGTGTHYSNSILTNNVVSHSATTTYTEYIRTYIRELLSQVDGDMGSLLYIWEDRENSLLYNKMYENGIGKPEYNTLLDYPSGLTICINRLWGAKVEVTEYTRNGDTYTCKLHYTFYDHFGLDADDVAEYGFLNGFRAWYILQHYSEYNGAYKPFVTIVEFDQTFTGNLT